MASADDGRIRSISRAFDLLRCFAPGGGGLSLHELATRVELPKSTTVRILAALRAEGMVDHDPVSHMYSPGIGFIRWAQVAGHRWGVPTAVTDLMRDAVSQHGESATLYVRFRDARVPIAHIPGTQSLRHVITVGEAMPLSAGAAAWILLQDADPEVLERVERELRAKKSRRTARDLVAEGRRRGYAVSAGERERGVAGVSVPVGNGHGELMAAVSFGGPTGRFTPDIVPTLVASLQDIADPIGSILGSRRTST